jgi:hypothetical protein
LELNPIVKALLGLVVEGERVVKVELSLGGALQKRKPGEKDPKREREIERRTVPGR